MPASKKPSTVWVHNRVSIERKSGHVSAGFVVLNTIIPVGEGRQRVAHPVLTSIHPGLCEMDRQSWEMHSSGGVYESGPRRVIEVDLGKLGGEELRQAVEDTADVPTVAKLAAMGGEIGEVAAEIVRTWGAGERSHRRALIEHLARPSNVQRAS